jgi:hypothetical protein
MELRNDQSRRYQGRSAQPGPERIRADMASAKEAAEAHLRATVERVGESTRQEALRLRSSVAGASDSVQFSRLAQQVAENDALESERRNKISELRQAYQEGRVNTRERVERSAERLLGR